MLFDLRCPGCDGTITGGRPELIARLTAAGKLKRGANPEEEILRELVRAAASSLRCDACGQVGLAPVDVRDDDGDRGDWQQARTCEACGAVLPPERLELFPNATLCVNCQTKEDRGESLDAAEYCPRCGEILTTRPTTGRGVTRWEVYCPSCGR